MRYLKIYWYWYYSVCYKSVMNIEESAILEKSRKRGCHLAGGGSGTKRREKAGEGWINLRVGRETGRGKGHGRGGGRISGAANDVGSSGSKTESN